MRRVRLEPVALQQRPRTGEKKNAHARRYTYIKIGDVQLTNYARVTKRKKKAAPPHGRVTEMTVCASLDFNE